MKGLVTKFAYFSKHDKNQVDILTKVYSVDIKYSFCGDQILENLRQLFLEDGVHILSNSKSPGCTLPLHCNVIGRKRI